MLSRDTRIESVGGAEVQQSILATALVGCGYRVSVICLDHGQPDRADIGGVTVLKTHKPDAGVPVLRFFHPRFTTVWKAVQAIDADIYYQRSAGVITGWVSLYCKQSGKPFIYAVANDADLDPALPLLESRRDRLIFRLGLRNASAIVVQNERQRQLCDVRLQRKSAVIRSCYAPPVGATCNEHGYVLWVSTLRDWKRPGIFLDIAEQLPHLRFRMIGGADKSVNLGAVRERAAALGNVEFLGYVPHARIEQHFDGARLFVNTSEVEGFPNTFLQAWSRGIPTVSFVSPVEGHEGGPMHLTVRNIMEMKEKVAALMENDALWSAQGSECRAFFYKNHSVETAVASYEKLFSGLLAYSRASHG